MSKTVFINEKERKFLISSFTKKELWDKEHIVYQWYVEKTKLVSTKIKIVFSLRDVRCIFVRVKKAKMLDGSNYKEVTYLEKNDIVLDSLLGYPFVAKRRAIKDDIYLDYFFRSNGCCQWLLEIENEASTIEASNLGIKIVKDVSNDTRYENASMTTTFEEDDLAKIKFLLSIIPGFELC